MEKSTLDSYKAEEREKSLKLFRKLSLLNLIHQPTEEFIKVFKEDMFSKPNDKAFFQVFYYLFNLFDPVEFKKRFYWPITDKKYEAMFRTATVSYINYLIEKNKLNWQTMKSYLVVKPGGMKFLTFLHEFIDFLIKELVKKHEKHLNIEKRPAYFDLEKLSVNSKVLKTYASKYASELEFQRDEIENFSTNLNKAFTKLYALTGIPEKILLESAFQKYFDDVNITFCKQHFNKSAEMDEFFNKLEILNSTEVEFNSSHNTFHDLKLMEEVLTEIKSLYPEVEFMGSHSSDLIKAYNKVFQFINQSHQLVEVQPRDRVDYENNELQRIRSETIQLETELNKFTSEYEYTEGDTAAFDTPKRSTREGLHNVLQAKFISTPTLKFSLECMKDMQLPPRIPFWDTSDLKNNNASNVPDNSIDSSDSFMNSNQKTAFQIPVTAKKNHSHSVSKKSNFGDPSQFLLSLKKDKHRSQINSPRKSSSFSSPKNLSNLASKWKANSEPFLQPPFSKTNQSIIKLQSTNEALLNLSTSPSGRFESIHIHTIENIPKIILTDCTESKDSRNCSSFENTFEKQYSQKTLTKLDFSKSFELRSEETSAQSFENLTITENTENDNVHVADLNLSNLCSAFQAQHLIDNNDSIFNISDTILNDVADF
ncbi:HAUS6 family protein [Megaselia abdita]